MSNKIKLYDEDTCREILRSTFKDSDFLKHFEEDPTPLNIPRDAFDSVVVVTSVEVDKQVYTCYSCKHGYFTVPYLFTDPAFNAEVTVNDTTSESEACWGVQQDSTGNWFVYPSYSHTYEEPNYFKSFNEAFERCESYNNKTSADTSTNACAKRVQYKLMTNFQYVLLHHPECIDSDLSGGVVGCPADYGLENLCSDERCTLPDCDACYKAPAKRDGKYVFYRFIECDLP